uniref:Piezo_RRas_bdg domain-containing protein n=1 Tax=Anisakis simplex TaxID=6269 RepID=A0A0M3JK70_ANISI
LNGYCDWLSNGYTSIFMLLILCPYWYLSITGAMTAQARLSIDRLFLEGSPMLEPSHYGICTNWYPVNLPSDILTNDILRNAHARLLDPPVQRILRMFIS